MRYLIVVLLVWVWSVDLVGQIALDTKDQVSGYRALPGETVYVDANTSFLLTGEYLFYKVYVFDTAEAALTTFSKVAYVELLGEEGARVFRHKILLKEGQGHGDFFIPTDVASGAYKLVAYTNWMHNQGQDDFYQCNMTIVNPYRTNQPELQKSNSIRSDSVSTSANDTLPDAVPAKETKEDIGPLRVLVNKKKFGTRDKVTLSLKGTETGQNISGNYSVSVRKKDLITEPFPKNAFTFSINGKKGKNTLASVGDSIVLPELRGELFQGKVIALEDGKSVKNLKIGVSVPGEDYVLEVVQTDVLGNFHVNIAKSYSGEKMFLQVLSPNPEGYSVQIIEPKILEYDQLDFEDLSIDFSLRKEILQRSIHNQIENSYFQFRPDSILTVVPKRFFDNKPKKTYLLDDYTRFRTLRETFVEIVQDVSSKRIDKDDYAVRVKGYDYAAVTDIPPLILLDGYLVQDHNTLLAFDARAIEEVHVFRDTFIFGPESYEGAVILRTREGNGYELFQYDTAISTFDLLKPQPAKRYFVQRYDAIDGNEVDKRLPDDRLQLLWLPELKVGQDEYHIEFFTSDVSGEFEIRLEGITDENEPVSVRKSIFVE
jgi:hypothetical protein